MSRTRLPYFSTHPPWAVVGAAANPFEARGDGFVSTLQPFKMPDVKFWRFVRVCATLARCALDGAANGHAPRQRLDRL
jgi:hypothetical protein